eukprot:TCALIF_07784-PA protein Name:"Protein of unknown function" AED:0.28 eAED:0.43 QI:0/1/0/1/1/1/3/0/1077
MPDRNSIWKEKDWRDTLVAPLKDQNPNSIACRLQEFVKNNPCPDLQSYLDDIYRQEIKKGNERARKDQERPIVPVQPGIKPTPKQKEGLVKYINSSKLFPGTFLVGQLLGLQGPQSERLVHNNGTLVGDCFEKDVFEALVAWQSNHPEVVTIFCGLELLGSKQHSNEFDFLIVLGEVKKVIYVECKYTLTKEIAEKIKKQAENAFNFLQEKLPLKKGWEFLTWACYEHTNLAPSSCCASCQPFRVTVSSLGSTLNRILARNIRQKLDEGYSSLVKTYLFYALENKQTFDGEQVAKHQLKMVDWPNEKIILWNLHQLVVLQNDPPRMIVKSGGLFGTGKTEIFKMKVAKLASGNPDKIAFLVACPEIGGHEQLLTKALRSHFQRGKLDNVKVGELRPGHKIPFILKEMFPNCEDHNQIHVFIDEASHQNKSAIDEFLAQLVKGCNTVIWIVDKDDSIFVPVNQGFVLETGLGLNLRNSEGVQKTIELSNHGESRFPGSSAEINHETLANAIHKGFLEEPSVKKILILVGDASWDSKWMSNEHGHDIKFYGYSSVSENCSDQELEDFFDPTNEKRQILMTSEDVAEGIEAEMVLVWDVHDAKRTTRHRARTKLVTAFKSLSAHPLLQRESEAPLFRPDTTRVLEHSEWLGVLEGQGLVWYSRLSQKEKLPVHFYSDYQEFVAKHGKWIRQYGPIKAVEQFHVIQRESPNLSIPTYPLVLWVQFENERTSFCIALKGKSLHEVDPKALSISNLSTVHRCDINLDKTIPAWKIWINVYIAEIIYSKAHNIPWDNWFDLRRLFNIWLRVFDELQRDQLQISFPPHELAVELLRNFLNSGDYIGDIVSILPLFAPNQEIHSWDLIQKLLAWWLPNYGDSLANHLIRWEHPNQPTNELHNFEGVPRSTFCYWDLSPHLECIRAVFTPKILLQSQDDDPLSPFQAKLMIQLKEEIASEYVFSPSVKLLKEKRLHFPWIWWIWIREMTLVWSEVLETNFPHVENEPWYDQVMEYQRTAQEEIRVLRSQRGSDSIFLQVENESPVVFLELNPSYRKIFNTLPELMRDILIFISAQSLRTVPPNIGSS